MRLKTIWLVCALALGLLAFAATGCGGGGTDTVTETVAASDDHDRGDDDRGQRPTTRGRDDDRRDRDRDDRDGRRIPTSRSSAPRTAGVRPPRERYLAGVLGDGRHRRPGGRGRDAEVRRRGSGGHPGRLPDARRRVLEDRRRARRRRSGLGRHACRRGSREAGAALTGDRLHASSPRPSQNISEWTQENCTNG